VANQPAINQATVCANSIDTSNPLLSVILGSNPDPSDGDKLVPAAYRVGNATGNVCSGDASIRAPMSLLLVAMTGIVAAIIHA